ncbi:cytochrome C biosynthesis protein [Ferrimonas marina]|uniref:Cytochrome c biogenesis protein CcdA n=1 Tax=Ferrimonas marina TaxID=299255 RepID=A0A1M5N6V4_9GAMM|nr:cytochrome C biosynthesis protein [Ferrimonas marina]SHG85162.1 Cytochrome c biogenesis protein CcdA [Ferrimonas marina]
MLRPFILLLALLSPLFPAVAQVEADTAPGVTLDYFFSQTCPHCSEASPFVQQLADHYPWLTLVKHDVADGSVRQHWQSLAARTGVAANSVPYMAACDRAIVGFNGVGDTGQYLLAQLKACYRSQGGEPGADPAFMAEMSGTSMAMIGSCDQGAAPGACDLSEPQRQVNLPLLGSVSPEAMSLPLLTVVLGGVDAFNPCAFFVLLFLLSVMVNAKSRKRMLLVGGIFVFFSGFIYFIFMAAWLNLFLLLGDVGNGIIMTAAGILALSAGFINVKEYVTTKGEVSLSMSAENRSSLIKRMGKLTKADNLGTMVFGSVVLAILANAYELLCTAGFPMIYTSVLSMHDLTNTEYYLYLVAYNVVYVIPLAAIVIAFAWSMGKRKLTEKEGQTLKLMSGLMMLGMGLTLILDPNALQSAVVAIGLILGSILLTLVITTVRKLRARQTDS